MPDDDDDNTIDVDVLIEFGQRTTKRLTDYVAALAAVADEPDDDAQVALCRLLDIELTEPTYSELYLGGRITVMVCDRCRALVALGGHSRRHSAWHLRVMAASKHAEYEAAIALDRAELAGMTLIAMAEADME